MVKKMIKWYYTLFDYYLWSWVSMIAIITFLIACIWMLTYKENSILAKETPCNQVIINGETHNIN